MSTRGGARSATDAAARTRARRAHARRRAGRLDSAIECAHEAGRSLRERIDAGQAQHLPAWAELVALACGTAIDGGRVEGVLLQLNTASAELLASTAADTEPARLAAARLHLEAGRLHALQRRVPAAREQLLAVLCAPDLATLEGEPGALLRLRAQAVLGATLCMHNEHAEGLQRLEQALAGFDGAGLDAAGLDRARVLINLGAAHFEQQRLDEAQRRTQQAQAVLLPLVRARRPGARADLGRALINLGGIQARAGRLAEGVRAYREALHAFDAALRSQRLAGDVSRLRGSRAKASMNLGYTLFKSGDFDAAQRYLTDSLRRYGPLSKDVPHLQADVARTLVNAAHLAARRGHTDRAAALYERGLKDFEVLMAGGAAPHLEADRANARLGLARMKSTRGRARRSVLLFDGAMTALRDLTHAGQLHHATAWLKAWVAQASVLIDHAGAAPVRSSMLPHLLRALRSPPLRALGEHEEPLRAPAAALHELERWLAISPRDSAQREAIDTLAPACLHYLLDCTAQWLSESSPAWLAPRQTAMQRWVGRLGDVASRLRGAPLLLAEWFLRTRGLRAQRIALASGASALVVALREALHELNRLEAELLGGLRGSALDADDANDADTPALLPAHADGPAPALVMQRAARWQALRAQVTGQLAQVTAAGLLPASLQLSAPDLVHRLAPGQAVLFVARLDATRLVAAALLAPGAGPACCWVIGLPARHADVSCELLNAAARQALRHDFSAAPARDLSPPRRPIAVAVAVAGASEAASGDRLALAALRDIAAHAVAPALRELLQAGCRDIAIVPADDLHLLPWGDVVRAVVPGPAAIAVYPSAGAWRRCCERDAALRTAPPQWAIACAAGPGDAPQLHWLESERRLSQRLWRECGAVVAPLADDSAQRGAFDSLLVMGHGDVPQGNLALSGLRLDHGQVLGAHDAAAGGGFEHVLLSACVLGRTDDAFGEPLGFLSACFGYRTRFGVGWLTEVPDDAACLFSLALQFTLRRALAAEARAALWSEAFHATCRCIEQGAWPDGFAIWLAEQGEDGGDPAPRWPASPPQSLLRVLPWAVALGA